MCPKKRNETFSNSKTIEWIKISINNHIIYDYSGKQNRRYRWCPLSIRLVLVVNNSHDKRTDTCAPLIIGIIRATVRLSAAMTSPNTKNY